MSDRDREATPTQKAAEVAWRLQAGQELTTNEVAEQYGMTYGGANKMMNIISARVPIVKVEDGRWKKLDW